MPSSHGQPKKQDKRKKGDLTKFEKNRVTSGEGLHKIEGLGNLCQLWHHLWESLKAMKN